VDLYYLIRTDEDGDTRVKGYTREKLLSLLNAWGEHSETRGGLWFVEPKYVNGEFSGLMVRDRILIIKGSVALPEVTEVAIAYDLPRDGGNA
jgi:hypothetical protein